MYAAGRAGELVGDNQPSMWQALDWLPCDCGSPTCAPRSQQGYIGSWALCYDISCRRMWKLSISGRDVVGTLDGVIPQEFHSNLIGP